MDESKTSAKAGTGIQKDEKQSKQKKSGMKGYYKATFLIGLGFFTMGLMDPLYDTYVPIFLGNFISLKGIIGTVMTLDNIFALLLIPVVSALSDKTRTPIGRRMPFIIVTLPLTAVFFSLLPYAALKSLAFLIIIIFFLNVFKQSARGPVVALMPDTIPGELRSEANGVINTMGGIAAIVGTVGLARLMDLSITLPVLGPTEGRLPFPLAGLLIVLATLFLFLFVKEKAKAKTEESRVPLKTSLKLVFGAADKSAFYILLSLLLWFLAYQGVLPFLGMYTLEFLQVTPGTAALSAGMVGIAYAIFAIPSGIAAHRVGRKKTIRISLIALAVICMFLYLHHPLMTALDLTGPTSLISFWALMFLFGIFWVSVITNSFPMLWQMASYDNMGIYTGLYYTFSQAAAILAPPVTGVIIDLLGFRMIFFFAAICMFAAFAVMAMVKRGEPDES